MSGDNVNIYLFTIPLAAAISLVYAASRHESWPKIWWHAGRLGLTIMGLMIATTTLLLFLHSRL